MKLRYCIRGYLFLGTGHLGKGDQTFSHNSYFANQYHIFIKGQGDPEDSIL
jgi:hypothetical protein